MQIRKTVTRLRLTLATGASQEEDSLPASGDFKPQETDVIPNVTPKATYEEKTEQSIIRTKHSHGFTKASTGTRAHYTKQTEEAIDGPRSPEWWNACHDILARPPYLIWLAKIPYLIRPR